MAFYIELNTILAIVLKPNEKTNKKKEKNGCTVEGIYLICTRAFCYLRALGYQKLVLKRQWSLDRFQGKW